MKDTFGTSVDFTPKTRKQIIFSKSFVSMFALFPENEIKVWIKTWILTDSSIEKYSANVLENLKQKSVWRRKIRNNIWVIKRNDDCNINEDYVIIFSMNNRKYICFSYIFIGIVDGQQRRSFGILECLHQKRTQV